MPLLLHGIPNCDTVKKAKTWLETHKIDYQFIDFRKDGIEPTEVSKWIASAGIDVVINKRGTTWRKLSPEQQAFATEAQAVKLICENPSLVKRPVLVGDDLLHIGFKPEQYETIFS